MSDSIYLLHINEMRTLEEMRTLDEGEDASGVMFMHSQGTLVKVIAVRFSMGSSVN